MCWVNYSSGDYFVSWNPAEFMTAPWSLLTWNPLTLNPLTFRRCVPFSVNNPKPTPKQPTIHSHPFPSLNQAEQHPPRVVNWPKWLTQGHFRYKYGLKKQARAFSLCKGPSLNLFRRPKPLQTDTEEKKHRYPQKP